MAVTKQNTPSIGSGGEKKTTNILTYFGAEPLKVKEEILTFAEQFDTTTKLCLCILVGNGIDFHVYSDMFSPLRRAECDR